MSISIGQENSNEFPIIFIGNLPMHTTTSDLSNIFVTFGEIKNIDVSVDNAKSKSHAFIEYEEYNDCLHAIENMNGSEIEKRVIKVSFSKSKTVSNTQRPIWMDESYYTKYNERIQENLMTEPDKLLSS